MMALHWAVRLTLGTIGNWSCMASTGHQGPGHNRVQQDTTGSRNQAPVSPGVLKSTGKVQKQFYCLSDYVKNSL